jgi:tetratricopeptide (TPR) repeat protein
MKSLVPFLTRLYQYTTVFLIIGSPLFFIPGTGFAPDVTYYVTIMVLAAIALISYVASALLTKSWHSVSKLEFISYFAFALAIILSCVFARNPRVALLGEAFNPLSAVSLLSLPVIVYLTRTLPEGLRTKMKYILALELGVSVFVLALVMMVNGTLVGTVKQVFSGFSSAVSFSAYIGIFVVALFFFAKKATLKLRYKIIVATAALVFVAWIVSIANSDAVRPNFISSLTVGKSVLVNDGIFGIGAGDYTRAWQLYRPQAVIASPYFGYDFNQGFSTMMTLLATVGIVGLLAFLALALSALYSTYRSYRLTKDGQEHFVTGLLALVLLYLAIISWVLPLSYSMLVVWMVIAGLGLGKAHLTEFHPSKKVGLLMVPLAVLLLINAGILVQKARAFAMYGKAANALQATGATDAVGNYLTAAENIYPYDGFYRAHVEYLISREQALVASPSQDQTALQNEYLKNAQDAVNAGLAAVQADNTNYQNYVSLGRTYELVIPFRKDEGYEHARDAYMEATKLYPNNPYLYVMLARLEASAGTKEGVRTQLTEALKKKENFADALYLMSQLEASDQKMDEALAYAIEAVKNAPNDPLTYVQVGLLFYGKKDYENAASALNTALEKDPNNANIAYFLALSLRDGGRPDLAKLLADELVKRDPTNADIKALAQSVANAKPVATTTPATKK